MTTPGERLAAWRTTLRRWQRPLVVGCTGALVLAAAALAVTPLRQRLLLGIERVADALDRRWDDRLAQGEALLAAGQYRAAADYLERLDRRFPAPNRYAGRDQQRERLLLALARSYERDGRHARALAVYQRLAAFDPRNFQDAFELAQAHARLDGGWAVPLEAAEGYRRVLALNPNHLPSVRGLIEYQLDRSDFAAVVATWEAYRDAFAMHRLVVHLGDAVGQINVPVDGRAHEVRLTLPRPPGWSGDLLIETFGFSLALDAITLTPRRRAGQLPPAPTMLPRAGLGLAATALDAARWRAEDSTSAVQLPVPRQPGGVAEVRLRVRLFKPLDAELWRQIEQSYRNQLDAAGLEASRSRVLLLPSAAMADRVEAQPG